ncbi:MAG TPA: hypothetical protein V6C58_02260 [Allocoleopsis sp.]
MNTAKLLCPKCGGSNTYKEGKNAAKNQMIHCRDCNKQLTLKKPDLSAINCLICNSPNVKHKAARLCTNCYQKKYYNRKRVEEAFDFNYPNGFDIENYLNEISVRYISKRANVKRDVLLYLARLQKSK